MKAIITSVFTALVILLMPQAADAQSLPPLQPEQDACGALTLCGNTFYTPYSYTGYGFKLEQIWNMAPPYMPFPFGESNSVWLKLTTATAGSIAFTITPVISTNDYDFSVYNITGKTCDSINVGTLVRASGCGVTGPTGLSNTATGVFAQSGTPSPSFISAIAANAGETYLILIDNFTTVGVAGFTCDFSASTATFVQSTAPHFDTIKAACDYSNGIDVHLTKQVKCSSLQTNGSDFRLQPAAATVSNAVGLNCSGGNGYTQDITLTFSNPLPPGTYKLKAQLGTDGNTLLDLCNTPMPVDDSISFVVLAPLSVNVGPDTVTCVHNSIQLNAVINGGVAGGNTIVWSPSTYLSNPNISNPVASPPGNITYTATVTPNGFGAQCAKSDALNIAVLQGFYLADHDTTICKGATVQLKAIGDPRYTYTWTPSTYIANPNGAVTQTTPDTTISYVVTASKVGCTDSSRAVTITVEPVPIVDAGPDITICFGDTLRQVPIITPAWFQNYAYSWSPATQLDFSNIRNPLFTAHDSTVLVLTVTTPIGCTGSDSRAINVVPHNFLTISADTGLCPNDTAMLRATGGTVYAWSPNLSIQDSTVGSPLVYPVTTTTYTVYAINNVGCRDTNRVTVTIFPHALLSLPDTVKIYPGESYLANPQGNCLYFTWFPQDGLSNAFISNPVVMPAVNTKYIVAGRTEAGCSTIDTMVADVVLESVIDMPNAFSPGSAPNAIFKPAYRGNVQLNAFRVYNRWGQKVFESSDIDKGWDGDLNGNPQPMGVYIYTVEATVQNSGRRFMKQGNVTLLR